MKKVSGFIAILALALIFTGCGGGSKSTRTFELDQEGIKTTLVYTYEGDKVIRQTAKNVIQYDLLGINSKEEAQEIFDPVTELFQGYAGLTHKIEYFDVNSIETIIVDYEILNFDEVRHLPGMLFDEDAETKGISMEESAKLLEGQGFTEVK